MHPACQPHPPALWHVVARGLTLAVSSTYTTGTTRHNKRRINGERDDGTNLHGFEDARARSPRLGSELSPSTKKGTRKGSRASRCGRGLGTTDEAEADALIRQLNELLVDETWWSAAKRSEAERKFAPSVVDAFFDEIQAGRADPWLTREKRLPLPGKDAGYSKVLFVGTTWRWKDDVAPSHDRVGSGPGSFPVHLYG